MVAWIWNQSRVVNRDADFLMSERKNHKEIRETISGMMNSFQNILNFEYNDVLQEEGSSRLR